MDGAFAGGGACGRWLPEKGNRSIGRLIRVGSDHGSPRGTPRGSWVCISGHVEDCGYIVLTACKSTARVKVMGMYLSTNRERLTY